MSKPNLYIVMEGGMVQAICSTTPETFAGMDIVVVDYDTDGADPSEIQMVPQQGGGEEPAIVAHWDVEKVEID